MKRLLTLFTLLFFAVLALSAQNLLNEQVYGFEVPGDLYIQNPDYISLSAAMVVAGDSALMFHCDDYSANTDNWQTMVGSAADAPDSAKVILPAGDYYVRIKVYATGEAPLKFSTNINNPWQAINWDITNVEKDKWVTLEQKITFAETNSKMSIKMTAAQRPASGSGTLYIDDIQILKDDYVMDTIPGNYLDAYYYGLEAGTDNIDGIFIPANSKAYVSFETDKNPDPMSNKYALKTIVPTLSELPLTSKGKTNNVSIQIGSKESLNGIGSAIIPAGDYTASVKVFMEERNISQFYTPFNDNAATPKEEKDEWLNIVWTVPANMALNEWVTLEQKITLAMDYDTKVTFKADQKDLVDTAKQAVFYIDDYAFVEATSTTDTTEVTDAYKAGNLYDEAIYGFEKSADFATDGWYPQKGAGADHYDFTSDKAASGNYSLRLRVAQNEADVPEKLKVQGSYAEGNSFTYTGGVYDMYLKVFITDGSKINSLNTNFSANKDENKQVIENPYKGIQWELEGVETGQWVELHRVDTLPAFDRAKLTIQILRDSLDYSNSPVEIYIDDLAAVYKTDYVPVPAIDVTAPVADSIFTTNHAAIEFKVSDFEIGSEGKISYKVNNGTAMLHEADTAIMLSDLTDGDYEVVLELVDMSGAPLNPVVSDTVKFSVSLPAALSQNEAFGLSVYPNPVSSVLYVKTDIGSRIQVYNLSGIEVIQAIQNSQLNSISVAGLRAGTYLVKVSHRTGSRIELIQVK